MIQKYLNYSAQRYASKWLVLCIDLITVIFSFILSYFIRFNLTLNFEVKNLLVQVPLVAVTSLLAFLIVGSYKGVVRHTGVRDVYNIFNAVCLFSILLIFVVMVNGQMNILSQFTIPLSIIIINSLITFVGLAASRFVFKSFYNKMNSNIKVSKNILIYGAGDSGVLTHGAIANNAKSRYKVIGYIDRDAKKIGKNINGVPVFARRTLTEVFIVKNNISEIIFSIQNIDSVKLRKTVEGLVDLPIVVKIVPPIEDWINGELKVSQIKQVQIEDLLDRAPITIKNSKIAMELMNKSVMVTGGAGSIGSEIVRQICNYDYKSLIVIDSAESALYDLQQELKQNGFHNFIPIVTDIRDKNRMNALFSEHKPNVVFHAAAYKHVPLMEYNSYEAIKINVGGTKNVADLSILHNVEKFVFVSTDKAVNPTNVMGATKRIAEMYISCMQKENKTKFITTRFGNVLGSNGSVIPLFRKQIEKGGPLTLTHKDITRYFMTIPEASQLVLEAGAMGAGGEIFIFDMGESVKIYDLAKNMIKLSGLRYPEDIDIKITGLRPGEKLYEELLANGENTLPTYHQKIKISKVRDVEYAKVRSKIDELCITNMFFSGNTIKLMKEIVPEYISKNSELCDFDKADSNKTSEQKLKVVKS
ncbi:NDP-sugar epimerase, includes UDP-GlcNAc-inverting 4,6-dehydratase FlaA1 and capsular polysaccharide biosynthesis protein EpsC [Maribacter dokdonensis]|uniref:NDP-sugar epimerase, includes UDP-GlcNAc-inverting 4,6-dehydratase FlaA1 and capsular polysaccharide biosynthesis protein EpsC n=1 Tax=Maribacter dokdonensis TaxID=320912 RepID=A0A1H4QFL1_9FLAO|nr:nucleoside-diphosphate sugar epimerase/dehydratase [Maribacter dokdonensis]SEC18374.1 NDP-sugar epimerase, includes UDP-GlcNAc-inverting 4,6-dehydratase FlaA1 and capsular polysaccharide biosynthesis protein EpsC [Maribacter dokdonensis]